MPQRTATLPAMEFDCEAVRRLLGKVRAGGGPGGTQRPPHLALPQLTPFLDAPQPSPISFPPPPKSLCCFDTSTHAVAQAGWEVAAVPLPQPSVVGSEAGGPSPPMNESLSAGDCLGKSRLSHCGGDRFCAVLPSGQSLTVLLFLYCAHLGCGHSVDAHGRQRDCRKVEGSPTVRSHLHPGGRMLSIPDSCPRAARTLSVRS